MDSLDVVRATLGHKKADEFHVMATGGITTESCESAAEESVNLAFADAINHFHWNEDLPLNGTLLPTFVGDLRREFMVALEPKHKNRRVLEEAFLEYEVRVLSKLYKTAARDK